MSDRTSPLIPPPPPLMPDGGKQAGKVIVLSAPRQSAFSTPPAQATHAESQNSLSTPAVQAASACGTSTSGRPMDVHSDVQQTSSVPTSLIPPAPLNSLGDALVDSHLGGRPMDVQMAPKQAAISAQRTARTTKQPSKNKERKNKKAELDERGRFRHTVRLDPKIERKLQLVAEVLGVDLNAAIAVCISVQHHRLTKPGGGDE